jgi:hypothetical protein
MVSYFVPILSDIVDHTLDKINQRDIFGKEIDIMYFTERCTIQMILATSFDIFSSDNVNSDEITDQVAEAVKM